jgi:hypothetical protein
MSEDIVITKTQNCYDEHRLQIISKVGTADLTETLPDSNPIFCNYCRGGVAFWIIKTQADLHVPSEKRSTKHKEIYETVDFVSGKKIVGQCLRNSSQLVKV